MKAPALILLAALAACSGRPEAPAVAMPPAGPASYADVRPIDAEPLAEGIAALAAQHLPPGTVAGTLRLTEADGDGTLAPALRNALTAAGYRVAEGETPAPHGLSYQVGPLDGGVLVRVAIDGRVRITRLFARTRAGLQPGPASVMVLGGRA